MSDHAEIVCSIFRKSHQTDGGRCANQVGEALHETGSRTGVVPQRNLASGNAVRSKSGSPVQRFLSLIWAWVGLRSGLQDVSDRRRQLDA